MICNSILKIISWIFELYVVVSPGTKGPNQYGDDLLHLHQSMKECI